MRLMFVAALVFASTNTFATPIKPDQTKIDVIQKVLDTFAAKKTDFRNLSRQKSRLETELGLSDAQGHPRSDEDLGSVERVKRYFMRQGPKYAEYLKAVKDGEDRRKELNTLAASAIEMTRQAYQVDPSMVSGIIVSGPPLARTEDDVPGYIGRQTTFAPIFDPSVPETQSGASLDDGTELLGFLAFDYPGKLAFVLFHEGQHFERILTPDLDLRNVPDWEVREREAQRPLLVDTFGLKADDLNRFEDGLKRDDERAVKWHDIMNAGLDPYKKSQQALFPGNNKFGWLNDEEGDALGAIHAGTRQQRELANREHDQRLKITIGELVRRSCDAPGSVSQGELDALAWPFDKNFCFGKFPPVLLNADGGGDCISSYHYICENLRGHVDAAELFNRSRPSTPYKTVQPTTPVRADRRAPFSSLMPHMMRLAEAACRAPETVSTQSLMPPYPLFFSSLDDTEAQQLLASAGDCESAVFLRIAAFIRNGQGASLDNETVRSMAAPFRYTPPAIPPTPSSPAPSRRDRQDDRDDTPRRSPDHEEVWRRVNPIIRH